MMDAVGLKSYNYDSLNNLTSISDTARNFTLNYAYDSVGNKLSMQSNKVSGTVYYSHYENNMMKAVTDVDGTVMIYVYDAMKHPANAFYPNGASVTYNYFPTNHRLQSLQNLNSSQELLSSFTCGYDNMGNITGVTDLTGTTTYKYDDFYELNSVTYPSNQNPVSYFYDGVGNRTNIKQTGTQTIGYGYGPGNEMTYESINSFSYDAVGNMVQRGNSSGTTTYTWDGRNQLIKVLNTFTPSTSINFVYDGDGHRVQKKFPKGTINYFYDGSSVVVETDGNGNILKTYNPGISSKDQQGNKLYYLYNGHGDVIALMDGKQSLVQSYVYDAFGSTLGDQKVTYPQSSIQI
jgi:YD repeat-containing protein